MEEEKKVKKEKRKIDLSIPRIVGICTILLIVFYVGRESTHLFTHKEDTLELGLKNMGELVTQSCNAKILEDSKENRKLFGIVFPFTESRQIYSYIVNVNASINFEQIEYTVDKTKKKIVIKMPKAHILEANLDEKSFKKYLDDESLFSRIPLDKQNEARLAMIEKAKTECMENKLLENADINGQRIIENFIKANPDYNDYKITFEYKENSKDEKN